MRVSGGGYGGSMHNRMRRSENVISFIARSHFPNDIRSHRVPQRYCKPMLLPLYAIICTLLETRDTAQTERQERLTARPVEGRRDGREETITVFYTCIQYIIVLPKQFVRVVSTSCSTVNRSEIKDGTGHDGRAKGTKICAHNNLYTQTTYTRYIIIIVIIVAKRKMKIVFVSQLVKPYYIICTYVLTFCILSVRICLSSSFLRQQYSPSNLNI